MKLCCLFYLVTAKESSRFARNEDFRCILKNINFMLNHTHVALNNLKWGNDKIQGIFSPHFFIERFQAGDTV